jgi:hypothetical protein
MDGSTGKTEALTCGSALFGLGPDAIQGTNTEAGLYELCGNLFSDMPLILDDIEGGMTKRAQQIEDTLKRAYNGKPRGCMNKQVMNGCSWFISGNHVPCAHDQAVTSRQVQLTFRKIPSFDPRLMVYLREIRPLLSSLIVDILQMPLNHAAREECVLYMSEVFAGTGLATRCAENWGLFLYYRLMIQKLIPCTDGDWDEIFTFVNKEVRETTAEYGDGAGSFNKFKLLLQKQLAHNDPFSPQGHFLQVHNYLEKKDAETGKNFIYFNLDTIMDIFVFNKHIPALTADSMKKDLHVLFKNTLRGENLVTSCTVQFMRKAEIIKHLKDTNAELPPHRESWNWLSQMCDEVKQSATAYRFHADVLMPEQQSHANSQNTREVVQSRLQTECKDGTWKGFEDMRNMEVINEEAKHCLFNGDNWDGPDGQMLQEAHLRLIEQLKSHYLPQGEHIYDGTENDDYPYIIPEFYQGVVEGQGIDPQVRAAACSERRRQMLQNAQNAQNAGAHHDSEDDDDDPALNQNLDDPGFIDNDLPDASTVQTEEGRWEYWLTSEGHPPCTNPFECRVCHIISSSNLAETPRKMCNMCFKDTWKDFQESERVNDEVIQAEEQARERVSNIVVTVANEGEEEGEEEDEDYLSADDNAEDIEHGDEDDAEEEALAQAQEEGEGYDDDEDEEEGEAEGEEEGEEYDEGEEEGEGYGEDEDVQIRTSAKRPRVARCDSDDEHSDE